jgi:hypothetical protein
MINSAKELPLNLKQRIALGQINHLRALESNLVSNILKDQTRTAKLNERATDFAKRLNMFEIQLEYLNGRLNDQFVPQIVVDDIKTEHARIT